MIFILTDAGWVGHVYGCIVFMVVDDLGFFRPTELGSF